MYFCFSSAYADLTHLCSRYITPTRYNFTKVVTIEMESKPVINFNRVTRNGGSGVMDISIKTRDKAGFICKYLTEGNVSHTKHFVLAAGVAIVDDHLGLIVPVTNIPDLVLRTKTHLKAKGISCENFASKVLNVNSPYFASMCSLKAGNLNKEWIQLCPKMQICFSRMAFWMDKVATPVAPQVVTDLNETREKKKTKASKQKKPRTLLEDIRRKLGQESGSSGQWKGYHHMRPDGDGAANVKLEATLDEIPEPNVGQYFEDIKEEDNEIIMEYEEGVTVIEILVDEGNVATIISEEVMDS